MSKVSIIFGNKLDSSDKDDIRPLLVSIIKERFDIIVSNWVTRLQTDLDTYRSRPYEELRKTTSEHLRSLLDVLITKSYNRLLAFVKSIAPMRISHSFPISGVQQSFFIGKSVIYEEIFKRTHLSPQDIQRVIRFIDDPFERAIIVYSEVYENLQVQEAEARTREQAKLEQEKRFLDEIRKEKEKTIQTERMAMVGQMAAKVAHEIKNPLSSISLNTELLEDEVLSFRAEATDEARDLIRSIAIEVDRLAQLSDEYLRFSRLPPLSFSKCDINRIITELADSQQKTLCRVNIELKSELDHKIPEIEVDKDQLRRAILNLLRNAAEAMPDSGFIRLKTELQNSYVRVSIIDNGIGISPEDMRNIFNPFFSTKSIGTGLGLSITRQIIEEHDGVITCQSQPNKGTIFIIQLPLNQKAFEINE